MKANTPEERKKLLAYLARVEKHIQSVFGKAYTDAIRMPEIRKAIENGEEFTFKNNVGASKRFKEVVAAFNKSASEVMFTAMKVMQKEGEQTAKDTKAEYAPLSKEQDTAVEHVRDKAKEAHTLQDRRISERVWQCGDNIKHEIEIVVQNGVKEGKSADEISRSVRSYLQQPNNLFKRIRNKETGELELSQAAKDYHPGRGVYRSSYANAMRLARTEMNIAYNTAELNRYANDPTCIGYEVRLSNNHTTKVDGKVKKLTDICDELQGRYPKNFKFVGWHPQCRCCIVPIYISDAEYKDYLKAKYKAEIQGKPFVYHSPNEVKQLPSNFKKWHENNAHRFEGANKPYFLKDNEGIINPKELTTLEKAELRHQERTPEEIAQIKAKAEARQKEQKLIATTASNVLKVAEKYGNIDSSTLKKYVDSGNLTAMKAETIKIAKEVSKQQKAEKAELTSSTKFANSILNLLGGIKDVDTTALNKAIASKDNKSILDEAQKLKAIGKQLTSLKLVQDPINAAKKFSLAEILAVEKAVESKIASWPSDNTTLKKKLEFEVTWLEKTKKHSTWEVAQYAYKAKLDAVNLSIEKQTLSDELSVLKQFKTKSKVYVDTISNAEAAIAKNDIQGAKQYVLDATLKKAFIEAKRMPKVISSTFTASDYTQQRKDKALWAKDPFEADTELRPNCGKIWNTLSHEEKEALYIYTKEYHNVNEPLRGQTYLGPISKAQAGLARIPRIESAIAKSRLERDMWVQRGAVGGLIELKKFGLTNTNNPTDAEVKALVGKTGVEGAFYSAGIAKGKGFNGAVIFNMYYPKGTQAFYLEPFSDYGHGVKGTSWDGKKKQSTIGGEAEILLQRGSELRVTKVEIVDSIWSKKYYVDVEVVNQVPVQFPYVGGYPFK